MAKRRGDDALRRRAKRTLPDIKALHLPGLRDLHLPDVKDIHLPELHAPEIDWGRGRMGSRAAALWPALFAAAGTGAAVWWWNQWARGRAEAEAAAQAEGAARPEVERSAADRAGGSAGAAAPEAIMAHAPPPRAQGARKPAGADGAPSETALEGASTSGTSRRP